MTLNDATDMAVRLAQLWRGPNAHEWETQLLPLDFEPAEKALTRLTQTFVGRLTVSDFMGCYRACRPRSEALEPVEVITDRLPARQLAELLRGAGCPDRFTQRIAQTERTTS